MKATLGVLSAYTVYHAIHGDFNFSVLCQWKNPKVTIQMEAAELYCSPVLSIKLYKVVLPSGSTGEIR